MTTVGPTLLVRLNKLVTNKDLTVERAEKVSILCVYLLKWVLLVKQFGEANFGTQIYDNK